MKGKGQAMSIHRVQADQLTSIARWLRDAQAVLEAGEAGAGPAPAGVPEVAGAVSAAEEAVTDLLEDAPLAVEFPPWANSVRLRMVESTLADCAAQADSIVVGDIELARALVQLALDAVESPS